MAVQVRKVYPFTPTFRQVASLYEAAFPACDPNVSNRAQRLKRLAFYEKNGYQALNHFYFEGTERYQILTTDKMLSLAALENALAKTFLGKHGVRVD